MALVKVISPVWRAIGLVYRLPGQRSAPPGLELDLPVQMVHDLGRLAERAIVQRVRTAAPIVVGAATTTAFAEVAALGFFNLVNQAAAGVQWALRDVDILIERISCTVSANVANVDDILVGVNTEAGDVALGRFSAPLGSGLLVAGGEACMGLENAGVPPQWPVSPLGRLPVGGSFRLRATSNAGGGFTAKVQVEVAIGPRGVFD